MKDLTYTACIHHIGTSHSTLLGRDPIDVDRPFDIKSGPHACYSGDTGGTSIPDSSTCP